MYQTVTATPSSSRSGRVTKSPSQRRSRRRRPHRVGEAGEHRRHDGELEHVAQGPALDGQAAQRHGERAAAGRRARSSWRRCRRPCGRRAGTASSERPERRGRSCRRPALPRRPRRWRGTCVAVRWSGHARGAARRGRSRGRAWPRRTPPSPSRGSGWRSPPASRWSCVLTHLSVWGRAAEPLLHGGQDVPDDLFQALVVGLGQAGDGHHGTRPLGRRSHPDEHPATPHDERRDEAARGPAGPRTG